MKTISRRTRRMAGVGTACLAVLGVTVVTAPVADAEAGRRVCVYSSTVGDDYFPVFAMDFRKDGGCPENKNLKSTKAGVGAQAVSTGKYKCDIFTVNVLKVKEYDPCPTMDNDEIYKITKNSKGSLKFESYGKYSDVDGSA